MNKINESREPINDVASIVISEKMQGLIRDEQRRILGAGYPSVIYHEAEGDSPGRIEWWATDQREEHLQDAFDRSLNADNEEKTDQALAQLMAHWDDVANRTFEALRSQGNRADLDSLMDAAAAQGECICPDNSAGWFLRRIAELAMAEITR